MLKKEDSALIPYILRIKELTRELSDSSKTCLGDDHQLRMDRIPDIQFDTEVVQHKKNLLNKITSGAQNKSGEDWTRQFIAKKQELYFEAMTQSKDHAFKLFARYSTELNLFHNMAQSKILSMIKNKSSRLTEREVLDFFVALRDCHYVLNKISTAIHSRMSALFNTSSLKITDPELLEFISKSKEACHQESPEYKLFKQITETDKSRGVSQIIKQLWEDKPEVQLISPEIASSLQIVIKEIEAIKKNTIDLNEASIRWIESNRLSPKSTEATLFRNKSY